MPAPRHGPYADAAAPRLPDFNEPDDISRAVLARAAAQRRRDLPLTDAAAAPAPWPPWTSAGDVLRCRHGHAGPTFVFFGRQRLLAGRPPPVPGQGRGVRQSVRVPLIARVRCRAHAGLLRAEHRPRPHWRRWARGAGRLHDGRRSTRRWATTRCPRAGGRTSCGVDRALSAAHRNGALAEQRTSSTSLTIVTTAARPDQPRTRRLPRPLPLELLQTRLRALRTCRGAACR
jgi:hypothetical protein